MRFISMIEYDKAAREIKREFEDQIEKHGRMTNMKKTLLHSLPAFKAYMEWYTLRDVLSTFLSDREIILFSYAISTENDCLICSTFFIKILIDDQEDLDELELNDREKLLFDFGRQIVKVPNNIDESIYRRLKENFNEKEIVLLTAFAGIMIATNTFNSVLKVELDGYLEGYRYRFEEGRD